MSTLKHFNKISRAITQTKSQAMLYSLNLNSHDFNKGQISIGNDWFEEKHCNNQSEILGEPLQLDINMGISILFSYILYFLISFIQRITLL